MGFRFSRRMRILPGLNLNFSGSGVSLSAGVPGARVTFGPRGTYASAGIPGTGLSYRQRIGGGRSPGSAPLREEDLNLTGDRTNDELVQKVLQQGTQNLTLTPGEARRYMADPRLKFLDPQTGRRLSGTQLEARIKAAELQEKIESLQVQLQHEAEAYRHFLDFWLPLPAIPSVADWQNARAPRPLDPQPPPPAAPDWPSGRAQLLEELTERHASSGWESHLPRFVAKAGAKKELATAWPEREAQLQQDYELRWQEYQQQLAEETARWNEAEAARIAWGDRLLAGDLEEVQHTVAEVVAGLKFPFETRCEFFLDDAQTIYLHLDLPEIEDVIPETRKEILKSGETREARRERPERTAEYARLVMGQCLYLAAEVFSYLPLAQTVHVAAYTQRPRLRESEPIDTYVLDVAFAREAVVEFTRQEQKLPAFLARLGARFVVNDDGGLGRIEPPAWLKRGDLEGAKS